PGVCWTERFSDCAPKRQGTAYGSLLSQGRRAQVEGAHSRDALARNDDGDTPHPQPSSPAKAGDPVLRGVSDRAERPQRTGYLAFAGYDGLWWRRNVRSPFEIGCLTTESGMSARRASAPQAGRGSGSSPAFREDVA